MRQLSTTKQAEVLRALVEGSSIRATCRITGVSKATVMRLLKIVGAHCKNHHDRFVRDIEVNRIQCDEIWSFAGCKERNVKPKDKGKGERGDVWTWTAIDADTKVMVGYKVGRRDVRTADAFLKDVADRLNNRIQLTTDGFNLYLDVVERVFGADIDYAMLVKIYGNTYERTDAAHRR